MPVTADTPTYLTVQEVADLLRLHPRTVRNWIRDGRLKAKKITASTKGLLIDQRDALGLLTDAGPEDVEEAAGDGPTQTTQARSDTEEGGKQ